MRIIRIMVAFAALTCFGVSAQADTALSGIPVLGEIANSGLLGGDILGGDLGLLPNLDVALGAVNNLLDPNNLHLDSLISNVLVNSLQGNFPRLTTDVLSGALLISVIESNLNGNLILVSSLPGLAE